MLKPLYFKACLKEIAIYFSLDPRRVSFHSLWVVGASALAAARVPDYIILDMGRWRSLAFLKYVRRTTEMFEIARYTVSRIDMITLIRSGSCTRAALRCKYIMLMSTHFNDYFVISNNKIVTKDLH